MFYLPGSFLGALGRLKRPGAARREPLDFFEADDDVHPYWRRSLGHFASRPGLLRPKRGVRP